MKTVKINPTFSHFLEQIDSLRIDFMLFGVYENERSNKIFSAIISWSIVYNLRHNRLIGKKSTSKKTIHDSATSALILVCSRYIIIIGG